MLASCAAVLLTLPLVAQDLRIGEHAVLPGGRVNVPVLVSNAAGLASASMIINYDPQMLTLEGITNGGLGQTFPIEFATSEGRVRVAAVRDTALADGSGALLVMQFRANAGVVPGMASPITFADRGLGGQYGRDFAWSGTVSHGNGSVRVVAAADDTNANGLPDWWEETFFGGPTSGDPSADPDGDGLTNLEEHRAGTDPLDRGSALRVERLGMDEEGVRIAFRTAVGKRYHVEYSNDLDAWSVLAADIPGTGEVIEVRDATPPVGRSRFYRLRTGG
jgi:hypothetical protein